MHVDTYRHKGLRRRLLKTIQAKGIDNEDVLRAMGAVPRHVFFDNALLEHAYEDKAFPIGEGQTISQPYTVAFQTQLLGDIRDQRVLEVGTGSGYQASVLCAMGARVFSIEYNERLYVATRRLLPKLGYYPHLLHGDGTLGCASFAPYAAILVTAAAPRIPQALLDQLNTHGRLVIPLGGRDQQQMLRITKQKDGSYQKEELDYFSFVPLRGADGWISS